MMKSCSKDSLEQFALEKLASIEGKGQRRILKPSTRSSHGRLTRENKNTISFSDNDYLGLSQDPRVKKATSDAALLYGAGAGASRLITGDTPLNARLERKLAEMKKTEGALVFGSGYLANISLIPALMRQGDLIILDELSHNCMFAGAKLSGADIQMFKHNDVDHAQQLLSTRDARRKLLMTETVFSMDGDLAPLSALHALCEEHGSWMMTDDAHGLGVLNTPNPAPIQMGTFSKAAGSYGGYVCGPQALIDLLINRGRGFIYTTGLPPATLAASLEALNIIEQEPERRDAVLNHARSFCKALDLPAPNSAIVPIIIGAEENALKASQKLADAGFIVTAIRPPTVPEGTSRLRVSFNANHTAEDVAALTTLLKPILQAKQKAA